MVYEHIRARTKRDGHLQVACNRGTKVRFKNAKTLPNRRISDWRLEEEGQQSSCKYFRQTMGEDKLAS